jgi:hypothetical protein
MWNNLNFGLNSSIVTAMLNFSLLKSYADNSCATPPNIILIVCHAFVKLTLLKTLTRKLAICGGSSRVLRRFFKGYYERGNEK